MKQYQLGLGMEKSRGISLPKKKLFFLLGNMFGGSVSDDRLRNSMLDQFTIERPSGDGPEERKALFNFREMWHNDTEENFFWFKTFSGDLVLAHRLRNGMLD
jgi:hypothetical protein